jgi:hypothetical protein
VQLTPIVLRFYPYQPHESAIAWNGIRHEDYPLKTISTDCISSVIQIGDDNLN